MADIIDWTAAELTKAYQEAKVSPVEVTKEVLDRADRSQKPEDYDGRAYDPGPQSFFCLFVFKLQPHATHGIAEQKVRVEGCQPIGRRILLTCIFVH